MAVGRHSRIIGWGGGRPKNYISYLIIIYSLIRTDCYIYHGGMEREGGHGGIIGWGGGCPKNYISYLIVIYSLIRTDRYIYCGGMKREGGTRDVGAGGAGRRAVGCGMRDAGRARDIRDDQEEEQSVSRAGSRYPVKSGSLEDWRSTEGGWYVWYLP